VYFEGSPPAEEPYSAMFGELSQFYMFPRFHGNISFLPNGKEERK
jgi:hypothetical protein